MQIIEIAVRDRVATKVGDEYYVCGNSDYVIHFDFDEEWDALDIKTARFIAEGNILYPDQIFSGSECPMPVISNTNNIRVGVFAGNLQTTTPARIPAYKSILCGTSTPAVEDEDAYHQAMEEMSKVATEARTQAAASSASAAAAAESAQEAATAAENAGQHSDDAETHANAAAESAQAAAASAEAADEAAKALQNASGEGDLLLVKAYDKTGSGLVAYADCTVEEVRAAVEAGKTCLLVDLAGRVYTYYAETVNDANAAETCPTFIAPAKYTSGQGIEYHRAQMRSTGEISTGGYKVAKTPNPKALALTGAVEATYDGSEAVEVEIPTPKALTLTGAAEATYDGSEAVEVEIPTPKALTLTGAVEATYDGSSAVEVEIPKGSSGKITILPETALTYDETQSAFVLTEPWSVFPGEGMVCTVTYNGVDYECTAVKAEGTDVETSLLGNTSLISTDGGNEDAPFVLICFKEAQGGLYCGAIPTDDAEAVTISIVTDTAGLISYVDAKTGATEVFNVTGTVSGTLASLTVSDLSHTYEEISAAMQAGKAVQMLLDTGYGLVLTFQAISRNEDTNNQSIMFQSIYLEAETAYVVELNNKTGEITLQTIATSLNAPEKGVDYWTEADKAEVVAEVIAALDAAEGVSF